MRKILIKKKDERSPYITKALKKSLTERNKLERLASKWPITYRESYRKYRNKLTSILRAAKNKYYKDQLKENQGDPKSQWKSINNILSRTSNKISHPSNFTDIAEKFNDFFLSACGPLNLEMNTNEHVQYFNNPPNFSMFLTPVSGDEIIKYLKNLKPTAAGYDDIPPKILASSSLYINVPLTHIINLSFKTGISPDNLKKAKVTPVYKLGNREDLNN